MSKEKIRFEVGRNIRLLRAFNDVKQAALAESLGISRSLISRYEDGQHLPSRDTLEKICAAMGVDFNDFFSISLSVRNTAGSGQFRSHYLDIARLAS